MKIRPQVSRLLVFVVLSALTAGTVYGETYGYDTAGRLISVVYPDTRTLNYSLDTSGNLLALMASSKAPVVSIVGGSRSINDSDGMAGETVAVMATATDSDGTIATSQWLINDEVVASGLTASLMLADGETQLVFKATDDGGVSATATATLVVGEVGAGPVWPAPFSGVTPDPALGLAFNNISALNSQDGLIYSCLRILANGEPSSFQGVERYEIAFAIVSTETGTVKVSQVRPFNSSAALNENGQAPDCSGSFDLTSNIYEDIIQAGTQVFNARFTVSDPVALSFQITSLTPVVAP
ncbi:MAG: hypothetical protein AB8B95_05350 [Pseudohongiellaceae bacterium]